MSRRTTAWRKRNVMGKEAVDTAQNILAYNNKHAGPKMVDNKVKYATVPMHEATAARIANVLHRRKV